MSIKAKKLEHKYYILSMGFKYDEYRTKFVRIFVSI